MKILNGNWIIIIIHILIKDSLLPYLLRKIHRNKKHCNYIQMRHKKCPKNNEIKKKM